MLKLLQSTWTAAAVGALTFMGTLLLLWHQLPRPTPARVADPVLASGPGFALAANPEIDLLIADLRQRSLELDTREQGLRELDLRIQAKAAELTPITQEVARLKQVIDDTFVRVEASEAANLKRLAKTYSAMAADNAAAILRRLEDSGVVKILAHMSEKEMAAVLEALAAPGGEETARVARLSEMLRRTAHSRPGVQTPGT
jgi:hypothetical protein